jgi:thiamine biosynthesis lipoprotein
MPLSFAAPWLATLCLASLVLGCGIGGGPDASRLTSRRKTSFDHFGSPCFALVFDDFGSAKAVEGFEATWQEIDGLLARIDGALSVDIPGSDVSRFNKAKGGESVSIGPITAELVSKAIEMYAFTGGAFNPAVAKLVDLWGFSPRFRKNDGRRMPYDRLLKSDGSLPLPDRRYVEAFRSLSDFSRVELGGDAANGFRLTKKARDIEIDGARYSLQLDLGGIAKGFAADKALEVLKRHGYAYGYVNLGMSSLQLLKRNVSDKGAKGPNLWGVSMSDPRERSRNFLDVFGKDTGVSTSGTDLHYVTGGREYSHIIDPSTGEPTKGDIASVTILGPDAAFDDALSTAICVMGRRRAEDFMKTRMTGYKVAFLARNGAALDLVTNMAEGDYAIAQ